MVRRKVLACRKVKAEQQISHRKIQPIDIPMWKWEKIKMKFITKFPKTPRGVDTIGVIVYNLTKISYFMPIQESFLAEKLAKVYIKEVVSRNKVPVLIVSDRDVHFTSRF